MYAFKNIIGNERLKESLKRSIRMGRTPHAVIFSGEKGIGKKMIAKTFAKALLCQEKDDEPCGVCISCRTLESGNHSDVICLAASKASIGVDEIRERIVKDVYIKPYKSEYKVFIIDDADKMTTAAQNAMLKTLEDSPGYAVFLLLAQNNGLFLPTVLSRCVCFKLDRLPTHMVRDCLITSGVNDYDSNIISGFCGGNIGRAHALAADSDFTAMRSLAVEIVRDIKGYDLVRTFSALKAFEPFKERIQEMLDILLIHYRDILMSNIHSDELGIVSGDVMHPYKNVELCDKIAAVLEAKWRLGRHTSFQMAIEAMLIKLSDFGEFIQKLNYTDIR